MICVQCLKGGDVEMVIVIVGQQDGVDWWQVFQGDVWCGDLVWFGKWNGIGVI